jgi:hypothetical protein
MTASPREVANFATNIPAGAEHHEKQPFFATFWGFQKILFQMLDRVFPGL